MIPQKAGVVPCVVHNNFIIGSDAKRRRFKEHGMWVVTSGDGLQGWTIENHPQDGKSASSGGSAGRRCLKQVWSQSATLEPDLYQLLAAV